MAKDYAIVPEKEVLKLKQDVDAIKKNPFQAYGTDNFIDSVNNLTKAINSLLELFRTASEEMKLEEMESATIGKKIEPMFSKLDMLVSQNEKIARGIVAVADMLEKPAAMPPAQPKPIIRQGPQMPMSHPAQRPPAMMPLAPKMGMSPPTMAMSPPKMEMPPPPMTPPAPAGMPPPPPPKKKKGLFG